MDPGQAPRPRLRLILDHTTKNADAATIAIVWNPEDELHGHLELSSTEDLGIDSITIYFEGISRNWINETNERIYRVIKAERKFLSQAHDILPSNISRKDSSPGAFVFEAPFHFIISRAIPCTNPDSPEQCLQLPPSLNLGEEFVDQCTGIRFAQPRIIYFLRATVSLTIRDHQDCKSLETFLPVTIAPYTEELPPTETDDFPMEFKERESKVLRQSLMGGTLGTMSVSLQEPPALVYDTSSTGSSTTALMRLEFQSTSTSSHDVPKSLQGLSFTVLSFVRVKTFYSVKSFPRLPSQTLLESFSEMRLRDGIIKLETQYVRNASWGYRFNLDNRTDGSPDSQLDPPISNKVTSENGNGQVSITSEPNGKWISNWTVPIEVDGRLLPSFCSSLVARFYTLIVRVKVAGARQERFDLEVPLQVIHTPPGKADSPMVEPVRERFLEYRRASESSWFSDDTLESEQDPPQYYL